MDSLGKALLLATLAGAAMPLGATIAQYEHIQPRWLELEFRHTVMAFGGGVLLAAVSLVLIPQGIMLLSLTEICLAFAGGAVVFLLIDRALARHGGTAAQLMAMLLDFVPEALAMGAALAAGKQVGLLLALLIALQNLPEGFNAFREIMSHRRVSPGSMIGVFAALVLLGPLMAFLGHVLLVSTPALLGAVMVFAAGGIIYLTFEDIAPQAALERTWAPSLGAVAGFLMGLIGKVALGA